MTNQPQKTKQITKARLVAALLNELDATWATVLAEDPVSKVVFNKNLQCDLKSPFEDSRVVMDIGEHRSTTLNCIVCFGGQRLSFTLRRLDGDKWALPDFIELTDYRHNARLAFASRMYSTEIITSRGSLYGYAVDINRDYLAIDFESEVGIEEGQSVRTIVRMVNTSFDVFFSQCNVAQVKKTSDRTFRVILRLDSPQTKGTEARRHERRLVDSSSIKLSSKLVDESGENPPMSIRNVSLGGLTVSEKHASNRQSQLIPGMIVTSSETSLSFLIVWARSNSMGLRPLLAEPKDLATWCAYVDQVAPPADHGSRATRKELANLLTHSGLLKGKRRDNFGRELDAHLVTQPNSESLLLTQRRVVADEHGEPVLYASLRRYTEQAWLFTDGVSFSDRKGSFVEMLQASIANSRSIMDLTPQLPRYLTFIWHHTVKSSGEFATIISKQAKTLALDAAQMSIKSVEAAVPNPRQTRIDSLRNLGADRRREIASAFSPELYEAIAGFDGSHPVLTSELARFGPYHKVMTKVSELANNKPLVAHRIFTHNIWSTTGVTNSVFVLCPKDMDAESLLSGIAALSRDEISYGTDDFLVIFDGKLGALDSLEKALPNPKRFTFLIQDLILNDALSFKDPGKKAS